MKVLDYTAVVDYLYTCLPMFHRIGPAAYKADLKNITELSRILGNPERKFKSIHVAGTNGKGSVSCMLASILKEAGYKTGLFTSPHLKDFRERFRINGEMISREEVTSFVGDYKDAFAEVQPSFFEWTTALAFHHFASQQVDIAVIETGLGGRLDSTNIIVPELSVITNISYDHQSLLGNSLEEIAHEKAGIIKKGIPVVIGERQPGIDEVFSNRVNELSSPVSFASDHYHASIKRNTGTSQTVVVEYGNQSMELESDLMGAYQLRNIGTVLQAVEMLTGFSIDKRAIQDGIRNVKKNAGLRGRWEVLSNRPMIVADVAHNVSGIQNVIDQVSRIQFEKLHIVIGFVNDKDVSGILSLLPSEAIYYFCKADIPRALETDSLKKMAMDYQLKGEQFPSVSAALEEARNEAGSTDLVLITGSIFVVAEVIY